MNSPKIIGILANPQKTNMLEYVIRIVDYAEKIGWKWFLNDKELADKIGHLENYIDEKEFCNKVDTIIALGGDGTILRAARLIGYCEKPIIGINLGGLGFLTETAPQYLEEVLDKLAKGEFSYQERMAISCSKTSCNEPWIALNDVVIAREDAISRLTKLIVQINGEYLTTYNADGLIISTPTGSTAHSLSAGGPIISPDTEVILITPICPHTLTNRPLIVNKSSNITINLDPVVNQGMITVDGQCSVQIEQGDQIIIKAAPYKIKLITFNTKSYYEILRQKLGWGGQRR